MHAMHSTLPDPVLALSLANVQKLKNIDVDQLANLWNGACVLRELNVEG